MWYIVGGAFAFACVGLGLYFAALAYEQVSFTRHYNHYGR